MADSKIEWTDKVWNPVTGCTKVSQGCKNCYAEKMHKRLAFMKSEHGPVISAKYQHPFSEVHCWETELDKPLHWKKPAKIFVNSMSDLFHPDVPFDFIDDVFGTIAFCPQHIFQILTKRPERMFEYMTTSEYVEGIQNIKNVWLGVSIEDQATADQRIPLLLQTPAALRFVSVEPMLGPVDLELVPLTDPYLTLNAITGVLQPLSEKETVSDDYKYFMKKSLKLDWVICGGESGPNARPLPPFWVRNLKSQCHMAGVPFFFKQWGEWTAEYPQGLSLAYRQQTWQYGSTFYKIGKSKTGHLLDGEEYRQFPEIRK